MIFNFNCTLNLYRENNTSFTFYLLLKEKTKGNERMQRTVLLEVCFVQLKLENYSPSVLERLPESVKTRTNLN